MNITFDLTGIKYFHRLQILQEEVLSSFKKAILLHKLWRWWRLPYLFLFGPTPRYWWPYINLIDNLRKASPMYCHAALTDDMKKEYGINLDIAYSLLEK